MKKLSVLFLVSIIFFSCNNDNIDEQEPQQELPCDNGTFVGDVLLKNQKEVDDFGALCYTKIEGRLKIGYDSTFSNLNDIDNLSSLSNLKEVTDRFDIFHTENLQNLNGLEGLESIYLISLFHNQALTDVSAIGNLSNISGGFHVQQNDNLMDFTGLEKIKKLKFLLVSNNPELNSFKGFDGLEIIEGNFRLNGNNKLRKIESLRGVKEIGGFSLYRCDVLGSLKGLHNVVDLGRLDLTNNSSIIDLNVFTGAIRHLTNIDSIYIHEMNSLKSLRGLDDIETSDLIEVTGCGSLISLDGINNLRDVRELRIGSSDLVFNTVANGLLKDFCALQRFIISGSYDSVIIENNGYNPTFIDFENGDCSQ